MIEIDSQTAPVRWKTGDGGRPSRPTISHRIDDGPEVVLMVELDCGHRFKIKEGDLVDGWGELIYACPFEHVTVQVPWRPVREVALRVHQAEERVRRVQRITSDVLGARLFMQMEDLLRRHQVLAQREDPAVNEEEVKLGFEIAELLERLDRFL